MKLQKKKSFNGSLDGTGSRGRAQPLVVQRKGKIENQKGEKIEGSRLNKKERSPESGSPLVKISLNNKQKRVYN